MGINERVRALEQASVVHSVTIIGIRHDADAMSAEYGGETFASEPNEQTADFIERMTQRARRDSRGHVLVLMGSDIDG